MKDFEVYPKLVGSAQLFFVFVSVLESRTNFALVH